MCSAPGRNTPPPFKSSSHARNLSKSKKKENAAWFEAMTPARQNKDPFARKLSRRLPSAHDGWEINLRRTLCLKNGRCEEKTIRTRGYMEEKIKKHTTDRSKFL